MTLNAATKAMARRAASALLLTAVLAPAPALAGDRSLIDYVGYSADGRYFAFEEYGMQDGSGFPYSNIYIIDLSADAWVEGSPYRVILNDDEADLSDARDAAYEQAEPKLEALEIFEAAFEIAHNGDGDPRTGSGETLVFGDPGYGLEAVTNPRTLTLDVFPAAPSTDCVIIDDKTFGFSLALDGTQIYTDADPVPASRGCPMGYRLYAVVKPAEWTVAPGGLVAIVSTYPFGFEGPDRDFLVVPLGN